MVTVWLHTDDVSANERKPRKDALRNRAAILAYAHKHFNEEGLGVSLHRIAEDLGFGIGTVYRHFPSHDDLVLAVYKESEAAFEEYAREKLTVEDPWDRLVQFFDATVKFLLERPVLSQISSRVYQVFPDEVNVSGLAEVIEQSITEAIEGGALRPDVTASDVAMLPNLLSDLVSIPEPTRSAVISRLQALLLDSLRPVGSERPALPGLSLEVADLTPLAHRDRRK